MTSALSFVARRGYASAAVLVTLAACAPAAAPPVVVAPPSPPAPPVPVTAEPSAAPPADPPPPPPSAPVSEADELAIAKAVCRAATKHVDGKVQVGCRTCPPFTSPDARPDGKVVADPETFFPIQGVYRGAFTAPRADQRAVVFQGCEPHSANYGGTLLVDADASGYRSRAYFTGVHPASCRPYRRPDGRDLLVCLWSDTHQGTSFDEVFVYDFALATEADVERGWKVLATVTRNDGAVCWGVNPDIGVLQGRIEGFQFKDVNGDGVPDVVIAIDHRRTPWSKALEQRVDAACKASRSDPPMVDATKMFGATQKGTLEFVWTKGGFEPTAQTKPLLRELTPGS